MYTKNQIIKAIEGLYNSKTISNDKVIEAIKLNIAKGNIEENDVTYIINKMYPVILDEEGNIINKFVLLDDNTKLAIEQKRAENYLKDTDWLAQKLGEYTARGLDTIEFIYKYQDILDERDRCRNILNNPNVDIEDMELLKKTVYTKADFLLKFITQEGRYMLKTLQFPADMAIEYKMTIVDIVAQFDATVSDRMDLSDSRVYDSLYFLSFLGFTNPTADEILLNITRIVKDI